MKSAFVTGGTGFLGKRLISALRARGTGVRALARSDAAAKVVTDLGAEPVRGDLQAGAAMQEGMRGCEVVFHSAALVQEHGKLDAFLATNVTGTRNTLEAARGAGVRRFVHVGTEAVLADGKPIVRADETRPLPARPAGPYAISKALAERAVLAANAPEFQTVVIRPRFIWGAGDTSLAVSMMEAVKQKRFAWMGGGHYLTSTCHVANVVEGALLAAEKGRAGEIYFLTDGAPVDFREFVTEMLAAHGVDAGTRTVPHWLAEVLAVTTSWMERPLVTRSAMAIVGVEVTVDDSKARRELGYVGQVSRQRGLAEIKAAPTHPG